MNRTNTFHLSQWEKSDRLLMADFNSDNSKIDAALTSLQNNKADTVVTSEMQSKLTDKVETVIGTYTGTGTANRVINLGFRPKAVIITNSGGYVASGAGYFGNIALDGYPTIVVSIIDTGFEIHIPTNNNSRINASGEALRYLALR